MKKDPYFKPVVFGGLINSLLTLIFAPGIFIWAGIGGYSATRLSAKTSKTKIPVLDALVIGLLSGVIGGTIVDILAVVSFKDPENKKMLVDALKTNWPTDMQPVPVFDEILPSIFLYTCLLIVIISIVFSILGSYFGFLVTKKKVAKSEESKEEKK